MPLPPPLKTTAKKAARPAKQLFALEVPALVRMCVTADNEDQAREIIKQLLGGGRLQTPAQIGVAFSLRVRSSAVPVNKKPL